jgi:hypothetical protein
LEGCFAVFRNKAGVKLEDSWVDMLGFVVTEEVLHLLNFHAAAGIDESLRNFAGNS